MYLIFKDDKTKNFFNWIPQLHEFKTLCSDLRPSPVILKPRRTPAVTFSFAISIFEHASVRVLVIVRYSRASVICVRTWAGPWRASAALKAGNSVSPVVWRHQPDRLSQRSTCPSHIQPAHHGEHSSPQNKYDEDDVLKRAFVDWNVCLCSSQRHTQVTRTILLIEIKLKLNKMQILDEKWILKTLRH